jgi:hypothetical protein
MNQTQILETALAKVLQGNAFEDVRSYKKQAADVLVTERRHVGMAQWRAGFAGRLSGNRFLSHGCLARSFPQVRSPFASHSVEST